jgi:hypothetical protein
MLFRKCKTPLLSIEHQKPFKKHIWSNNFLFLLFKEDKNLSYRVYGKDTYLPYDTQISLNLVSDNIIEDFHIHSDYKNNHKCMLVSRKELKVLDIQQK